MKNYNAFMISVVILFSFTACGGGKSPPAVTNSPPQVAISSESGGVSSNSSSSSNASSTSSEPEFASNGTIYCTWAGIDPDSDGWGWENNASCIVKNSMADPDIDPDFEGCIVGTVAWAYCSVDMGSWGFENGGACIAQSFCPASRSANQRTLSTRLVDPNAKTTTQTVFDYLHAIWGEKMLSGQQDLTWNDGTDMYQRVLDDTGKAPAVMGYDFMEYGKVSGAGLLQTEEAIAHWNRGGLVTFCWHWRDPTKISGAEFYTKDTDFEIPMTASGLDLTSSDFASIQVDVDLIAVELKKLDAAGVPILWRPLHEAAGGWFWWGRRRTDEIFPAQANVALWRYLYDRLTNHHELHNLIWVWNGQNITWYPGDSYVDIVSTDVYDDPQHYDSQKAVYGTTAKFPLQEKLVALSENSNIPDPDRILADNAWWLYFVTWNDGSGAAGVTNNNNFWTGEYYNTNAHKQHVYNHDLVITLDELPNF